MIRIRASPGQASKLRNGKRVRIRQAMEGEGIGVMVSPHTYSIVSRSFGRNKGVDISLTPEEIRANSQIEDMDEYDESMMEGGGLFKKVKKGLSKAGNTIKEGAFATNKFLKSNPTTRTIVKEVAPELAGMMAEQAATYVTGNPAVGKIAKKGVTRGAKYGLEKEGYGLGKKIRRGLSKAGNTIKEGAFATNKFLKSNPTTRTIVKEVAPELAGMLAEEAMTYITGNPEAAKVVRKGVHKGAKAGLESEGYGLTKTEGYGLTKSHTGHRQSFGIVGSTQSGMDHLREAGYGKLLGNAESAHHNKASIDKRFGMPPAPNEKLKNAFNMTGRGASISSHHSSALVPQPYSANYHMKNMLPPAYQKYSSGHVQPGGQGLYAGRGLYA
jgi:hypothetical protein